MKFEGAAMELECRDEDRFEFEVNVFFVNLEVSTFRGKVGAEDIFCQFCSGVRERSKA